MSDFEIITAYSEQISLFFTAITVLTTILFGFLIAAQMVAGRLSLLLLFLVCGLFSVVSFGFVGAIYATGMRAQSIGEELVARISAEGSAIHWVYPGIIPPDLPRIFFYLFTLAIILSLLFAFIRRKEMRKQQSRSSTGPDS